MKKLKLMGLSLVAILSICFVLSGRASAAEPLHNKCEVFARSYSAQATTITATFDVRNTVDNTPCTKEVTVASWNAPNGTNGMPFSEQTFVDSKSGTFAPGFHSLTVQKPKCFYQVDLLRGLSPFGPNGGVDYTAGQFVSSSHGGHACPPPTTPKPPAPPTPPTPPAQNITQVQNVNQVVSVAPAPVVAAAPTKASLPNTGIESAFGGIVGMTGLATVGYMYNKSRKAIKGQKPINKSRS